MTLETGDVVARVWVAAFVEVEHPATAGSVVDWARSELDKLGFEIQAIKPLDAPDMADQL